MNVPKYDFFIGARISPYRLLLVEGEKRDPATGLPEPDDRFISTLSAVAISSEYIFLDIELKRYASTIYYYDKDENLIGTESLLERGRTRLYVPTGTTQFALSFLKEEPALAAYLQDPTFEGEDYKYVDFAYSFRPVNPVYKKLTKKIAKESGQELFRTTLEGNISFFGQDYEYLVTSSLETRFVFVIYKDVSIEQVYFEGYFKKTDCTFDTQRKSCKVKLAGEDNYSPILDAKDHTFNLLELGVPTTDVAIKKRPLIQIYILGENRITNVMDNTYWEDDVSEAQENPVTLDTTYHFTKTGSYGEFDAKFGEAGFFIESLTDQFIGTFQESSTIYGRQRRLKCKLTKVASRGEQFKGPYAQKNVQGLNSRANVNNTYGSETGFTRFKYDTYRLVISNVYNTEYIPPTPEDTFVFISDYNFYIDNAQNKTLGLGPAITFKGTSIEAQGLDGLVDNIFEHAVFQRLLCDTDTINLPGGGVRDTYDIPVNDFVGDRRNYKKCYGIDFGQIIASNVTSERVTPYGKNDEGRYFVKPVSQSSTRVIPLNRSAWTNISLWYIFSELYPELSASASKEYILEDAFKISDVIQALLKKIAPGIKHEATPFYSHFLYDSINPVYGPHFDVLITQKTNILKGEYDQAAQRADITFESLMNMLQSCFKCYWWIEGNKFKVEHISWLLQNKLPEQTAPTVDLLPLLDRFNKKPILYFQSELSYDKDALPGRFEFEYMDEQTDAFSQVYINVVSDYVSKDKIENVTVSDFSADVDYMLTWPTAFSEDGFALLGAVPGDAGVLELPEISLTRRDERGQTYEALIQNGYMSWLYLVNFYMYDMPARTIEGNYPAGLQVQTICPSMNQKVVMQMPEEEINIYSSIITQFGPGKIGEMSVDLDTQSTTLSLSYEPK